MPWPVLTAASLAVVAGGLHVLLGAVLVGGCGEGSRGEGRDTECEGGGEGDGAEFDDADVHRSSLEEW